MLARRLIPYLSSFLSANRGRIQGFEGLEGSPLRRDIDRRLYQHIQQPGFSFQQQLNSE